MRKDSNQYPLRNILYKELQLRNVDSWLYNGVTSPFALITFFPNEKFEKFDLSPLSSSSQTLN